MKESKIKVVAKAWGAEKWLVNNKEYCGKLLLLNEGAMCSYHYHPKKKETFYVLEGCVQFIIEDAGYCILGDSGQPKTINPSEKHMFKGLTNAVILEISTHHEDDDCVRLTESRSK